MIDSERVQNHTQSRVVPVEQKNHRSAIMHKAAVENDLVDQINKRHYTVASEKPSVISALPAIRNDDNSMRIIHDGSRPVGQAMNHYSYQTALNF